MYEQNTNGNDYISVMIADQTWDNSSDNCKFFQPMLKETSDMTQDNLVIIVHITYERRLHTNQFGSTHSVLYSFNHIIFT